MRLDAGDDARGDLRLRPLRGLCLRLTFRLAATRLLGAMRLFFVGIRYGAESQLPRLPSTIRLSFVEDFMGDRIAATQL